MLYLSTSWRNLSLEAGLMVEKLQSDQNQAGEFTYVVDVKVGEKDIP